VLETPPPPPPPPITVTFTTGEPKEGTVQVASEAVIVVDAVKPPFSATPCKIEDCFMLATVIR
jgi:hypothetical protein